MKLKNICKIIVLVCLIQEFPAAQNYLEREDIWVRGTMSDMTLDQKIGQLFMVRTYSKGNMEEERIISEFITNYHIGGVCFFQGSPLYQVNLVNKYQQLSKIPLFVGIDGEFGLGMRFPGQTISFPKQLMLGAIKDDKLIYEMGTEIARQCKKTGININFAPSVDINNNQKNKVIYDRSFGECPENVMSKGYMYMKAMEDEGILSCVKHFPGHGDTDVDSHIELPILTQSLPMLEMNAFYPFRRLASQGAGGMMVGHLHVPSIDDRTNRPTTLSEKVIKNILRKDMGYKGLIFTDAMDMKGVTKYFPNGIAEAEAFMAGNDVILLPQNLYKAISSIKEYINSGKISIQRLNESVERILRTKYKLGLQVTPFHHPEGLSVFLNRNKALALKQKLTEAALTLVSDEDHIIPVKKTDEVHFATLSINVVKKTTFQRRVDDYISPRHYQLMPHQLNTNASQLIQTLSCFDVVLVSIHSSGRLNDFSKNLSDDLVKFLLELDSKTTVVISLFGSPYLLKNLTGLNNILLCYNNDKITQDIAAQSIFGANDITGELPVSVSEKWMVGYGLP
ncbi:MAG: beta-N-acetylhexosaminidase, partial [Saprospiraceae bacterium]|nr:beta-N-acetylhexosaminidase [Saprospiraceae bacterium]